MDLNHDIELGQGTYISDAPPSPLSADVTLSGANPNYMRTTSGKKIDRRLWVFVMVAVFTLALMVFSMVMLCIGRSESVWLPIMTFALGVWTGQLPGTNATPPKSPSNSPAQ
jgi:hypothetical protein